MAGQPKTRRTLREISDQIEALGHAEDQTGDEWLFDAVAGGLRWNQLAKQLGTSRQMLDKWVNLVPGRKEKLTAARKEAMHALTDELVEDFDLLQARGASVESAEVQVVNSKANYIKWLASVRNREAYGEQSTLAVVSGGDLHFLMLQRFGSALPKQKQIEDEDIPVIQGHVVESLPAPSLAEDEDAISELSEA
jgi:hypothetical protein